MYISKKQKINQECWDQKLRTENGSLERKWDQLMIAKLR